MGAKPSWRHFVKWEPRPGAPVPRAFWPFRQRVFRLVLLSIPIFLLGAIVYGWQLFSGMLLAEGAYSNVCSLEELANHAARVALDAEARFTPACNRQDQRIQIIYNLNMALELAMGALAGACLDAWGPFRSALLGHAIMLPAVILLAAASVAHSWMYTAGAALLGVGTNFIVFPAVVIADLFPTRSGLVVSLVVAAQNAGAVVTTFMDLLYRKAGVDFSVIFAVFAGCICLPCQVLSLLATPVLRPSLDPQLLEGDSSLPRGVSPITQTQQQQQQQPPQQRLSRLLSSASAVAISPLLCEAAHVTNRSFAALPPAVAGSRSTGSLCSGELMAEAAAAGDPRSLASLEFSLSAAAAEHMKKEDFSRAGNAGTSFRKALLSWEMGLFSIFCFLVVLMYNYYSVVLREVSGVQVARVNGYGMPSLALWGVLYGVAVDSVGTLFMSHVTTAIIAVVYGCVISGIIALHYFATILHIVGSACVYTLKFTFLSEFFAAKNQGKLLAVLSLVSGFSMLANIACKAIQNERAVLAYMLGLTPICTLLVGAISFRQTKTFAMARALAAPRSAAA